MCLRVCGLSVTDGALSAVLRLSEQRGERRASSINVFLSATTFE